MHSNFMVIICLWHECIKYDCDVGACGPARWCSSDNNDASVHNTAFPCSSKANHVSLLNLCLPLNVSHFFFKPGDVYSNKKGKQQGPKTGKGAGKTTPPGMLSQYSPHRAIKAQVKVVCLVHATCKFWQGHSHMTEWSHPAGPPGPHQMTSRRQSIWVQSQTPICRRNESESINLYAPRGPQTPH
jgi:hypothetical protein